MIATPALSDFASAADELRQQELARLSDAIVPRIEAFGSAVARSTRPEGFDR